MIITVTNTAGHPISIEWFQLGVLETGQSVTKSFTAEEAHNIAGIMKKLVDLNKISVSVADDPALLDKVETATIESTLILTTATTLYVDATGSDTTGNGSVSSPFRQVQRALVELEKYSAIQAAVTISVGAGDFDAFAVDGERIKIVQAAGPGETVGSLTIKGATQAPTLTTGNTSGTLSATATVIDGSSVCVDSTANWTSGELKGKWVLFGSNYYLITDNTTTTFRITTTFAPSSGATYSFLETASAITTATASVSGLSATSGILISNVNLSRTAALTIQWFSVTPPSSSNAVSVYQSTVALSYLDMSRAASGTLLSLLGYGVSAVTACRFRGTGTVTGISRITSGAVGPLAVSTCFFQNLTTGCALGFGTNSVSTSTFDTCTTATSFGNGGGTLATCRFVSCTLAVSLIGVSTGQGNEYISVSTGNSGGVDCFFGSCTTILSSSAYSNAGVVGLRNCTGSGNTNGIVITKGMRIQIGASATLGVSGNELSVDGVTGTLATMRGNSPKVFPLVPNAYGSYVYE